MKMRNLTDLFQSISTSLAKPSTWTRSTACAAMLLASMTSAQAAGFDCAQARTPTETYICLDYRVSDLDSALSEVYRKALSRAQNKSNLQTDQKMWTKLRDECTTPECLINEYRKRIQELNPNHPLAVEPGHNVPWDAKEMVANYKVIGNAKVFVNGKVDGELVERTQGRSRISEYLGKTETPTPFGSTPFDYCPYRVGAAQTLLLQWPEQKTTRWLISFLNRSSVEGAAPCEEVKLALDGRAFGIEMYHQPSTKNIWLGVRAPLYGSPKEPTSKQVDYYVRFDKSFFTASSHVGRDLWLGWLTDVLPLVKSACSQVKGDQLAVCLQSELAKRIAFAQTRVR